MQSYTPPIQVLPPWLTYSSFTVTYPTGGSSIITTVLNLPLTYYGPYIPLPTDGSWVWGGLTSPAPSSTTPTLTSSTSTTSATSTPTLFPQSSTAFASSTSSSTSSSSSPLSTSFASVSTLPFPPSETLLSMKSVLSLASVASTSSAAASSSAAAAAQQSLPVLDRKVIIVISLFGFLALVLCLAGTYACIRRGRHQNERRRRGSMIIVEDTPHHEPPEQQQTFGYTVGPRDPDPNRHSGFLSAAAMIFSRLRRRSREEEEWSFVQPVEAGEEGYNPGMAEIGRIRLVQPALPQGQPGTRQNSAGTSEPPDPTNDPSVHSSTIFYPVDADTYPASTIGSQRARQADVEEHFAAPTSPQLPGSPLSETSESAQFLQQIDPDQYNWRQPGSSTVEAARATTERRKQKGLLGIAPDLLRNIGRRISWTVTGNDRTLERQSTPPRTPTQLNPPPRTYTPDRSGYSGSAQSGQTAFFTPPGSPAFPSPFSNEARPRTPQTPTSSRRRYQVTSEPLPSSPAFVIGSNSPALSSRDVDVLDERPPPPTIAITHDSLRRSTSAAPATAPVNDEEDGESQAHSHFPPPGLEYVRPDVWDGEDGSENSGLLDLEEEPPAPGVGWRGLRVRESAQSADGLRPFDNGQAVRISDRGEHSRESSQQASLHTYGSSLASGSHSPRRGDYSGSSRSRGSSARLHSQSYGRLRQEPSLSAFGGEGGGGTFGPSTARSRVIEGDEPEESTSRSRSPEGPAPQRRSASGQSWTVAEWMGK